LFGRQIVVLDDHGNVDDMKSYKILYIPVRNTSRLSINHPLFDTNELALHVLQTYPEFEKRYIHSGSWNYINDQRLLGHLNHNDMGVKQMEGRRPTGNEHEIIMLTFLKK